MVQLHYGSEHAMSVPTDVPAPTAWHLDDEAAHMQPPEQPPHRGSLALALSWIFGRSIEDRADVGVAEAMHQMVAVQCLPEQCHVRETGGVEAGITPTAHNHRLSELLDLPIGGCRVVDHRQRLQVA